MQYITKQVQPEVFLNVWVDIVRLHTKVFPDDITYLPDSGHWFITYENETPIAFAGLVDHETIKKGRKTTKIGLLIRSGVLAEHRGNGLQKELIQIRLEKARELKYNQLYTYTSIDNIHSINNIIDSGFHMFIPEYQWAGETLLYWRITL